MQLHMPGSTLTPQVHHHEYCSVLKALNMVLCLLCLQVLPSSQAKSTQCSMAMAAQQSSCRIQMCSCQARLCLMPQVIHGGWCSMTRSLIQGTRELTASLQVRVAAIVNPCLLLISQHARACKWLCHVSALTLMQESSSSSQLRLMTLCCCRGRGSSV